MVDASEREFAHELALALLVEVIERALLTVRAVRHDAKVERTLGARTEVGVRLGAQIEQEPVDRRELEGNRVRPVPTQIEAGNPRVVRQTVRRNSVSGSHESEQGRVHDDVATEPGV